MFSGHEDSLLAFFDIETLDYVSDLMQGEVSLENRHKYYKIYNHSIPHSMGQRIIRTSDGNFLMAEYGDSGVYGFSRGLMLPITADREIPSASAISCLLNSLP